MARKRIVRFASSNSIFEDEANIHPLLKRIYSHRNIRSLDELDKSLKKLLPFRTLKDIDVACELLAEAIANNERIVIIGDFDADGATSTTVAVKALRMMGANDVHYLVPNRFEFGYGLSPEIVVEASKLNPQLIVTVDNGIANIDGVNKAKELGMKVLITDHHLAADELPAADAIVNPNQPGDEFPAKSTAGVGVIFYVMMALRAYLREAGWFETTGLKEPNIATLLDIVALGTVADVVPLEQNNRILVSQGIQRIRAGHVCPGIKALLEVSGRTTQNVTTSDFGFAIGPRLNAAGRLEDMSIGIQCLLSDNISEAQLLAEQLHQLNIERKQIEKEMQDQALHTIENLHIGEGGQLPYGITLYQADWHQGVIGILASRIKDRYHRPTIVFAEANETELKGSARSVPGIHIRDVLDIISKRHPGILIKFGGHAMAAGLSISKESFESFQQAFDQELQAQFGNDEVEGIIHSDGELTQTDFDINLAQLLKDVEPWGQNFPEPIFDGFFQIVDQRIVGEKHLKLRIKPNNHFRAIEGIAFNAIDHNQTKSPFNTGEEIHLTYRLDVNEFRGNRSLQLMIDHLQSSTEAKIEEESV